MREARRRRWWGRGADISMFRTQMVLTTTALGLLVAGVLVVVTQVVLAVDTSSTVDRVIVGRADDLVTVIDTASTSRLDVPSTALDPGVVVFDDSGAAVAGEVPESQQRFYDRLATSDSAQSIRLGDAFVLYARPFETASGNSGVVVISERLDTYENNETAALVVSVVAGGLIVVLGAALANWASKRALAPVRDMARTAEDWSEHDLSQRFALGEPTNEIRQLGQTLDHLLERVARAILAEQRLTSELAHELRTPLTAIHATVQLIAMNDHLDTDVRDDLQDITVACNAMAATITALIDLARAQTGAATAPTDITEVIEAAVLETGDAHRVTVRIAAGLITDAPKSLAVRALAPVVHNALRYGEVVEVSASAEGAWIDVRVHDDGPGVTVGAEDDVFTPGFTASGGSGLGLALARRVARSVGGDVTLRDSGTDRTRGAVFVLRLPRQGSHHS